jgi:hypothetical protein
MIDTIALNFTSESLNSYDPLHLILGTSIGIVTVVILIKKIFDRRNKK